MSLNNSNNKEQEEPEVEIRLFEVPLSQQIKGLHDDLYDVGSFAHDLCTTSSR